MQIRKGMMLDFMKLGQGLIVSVNRAYESTIGKDPYAFQVAHTDDRVILTNKYEVDVLVDAQVHTMDIVLHYEWMGDLCRIDWRVVKSGPFAPSGLANILWGEATLS